jgi:hypothetical protein
MLLFYSKIPSRLPHYIHSLCVIFLNSKLRLCFSYRHQNILHCLIVKATVTVITKNSCVSVGWGKVIIIRSFQPTDEFHHHARFRLCFLETGSHRHPVNRQDRKHKEPYPSVQEWYDPFHLQRDPVTWMSLDRSGFGKCYPGSPMTMLHCGKGNRDVGRPLWHEVWLNSPWHWLGERVGREWGISRQRSPL